MVRSEGEYWKVPLGTIKCRNCLEQMKGENFPAFSLRGEKARAQNCPSQSDPFELTMYVCADLTQVLWSHTQVSHRALLQQGVPSEALVQAQGQVSAAQPRAQDSRDLRLVSSTTTGSGFITGTDAVLIEHFRRTHRSRSV